MTKESGERFDTTLIETGTKTSTLWDIYVEEVLCTSRHASGSRWKLSEEGRTLLPDEIKRKIEGNAPRFKDFHEIAFATVAETGVERLAKIADENKILLKELIALIAAYASEIKDESV